MDNNAEDNIRKTIENIITADSILQKYPQLLTLVQSITNLEYWIDFTGGNYNDKIEAAKIEFTIKNTKNKEEIITHYLEYFYLGNWSYADVPRMLLWRTDKKNQNILKIEDTELTTLSDHEKNIRLLANDLLGIQNDMPLEHFVRFLIVLLSRIVQKNRRSIENQAEELGINVDNQ